MKYFLGVCLMVALVSAQPAPPKRSKSESPSTPCETPKQFIASYGTYMRSRNATFRQNGAFYYDRDNERNRVDTVIKGIYYRIVQEYQKGEQYVMFTMGGKAMCVRQHMSWPYMPLDIPPGALELEHGRIGTKEHGLDIRRFYAGNEDESVLLTVTADDCLWTSSISRFAKRGLIYFSLTDITSMAVNEADFKHPPDAECPLQEEMPDNPYANFFA